MLLDSLSSLEIFIEIGCLPKGYVASLPEFTGLMQEMLFVIGLYCSRTHN